MELITKAQLEKLVGNGRKQATVKGTDDEIDFKPVVKLFTPWGKATWLLSEIDPEDKDIAFGLCDLGHGFPEVGSVWLPELRELAGPFGLTVERDLHWKASKTLGQYAAEARKYGHIMA